MKMFLTPIPMGYIFRSFSFCESMLNVSDFKNINQFLTATLLKQENFINHFLNSTMDTQS